MLRCSKRPLQSALQSLYFYPCCTAPKGVHYAQRRYRFTSPLGDIDMLTAEQVLASQKATIETLFGLTGKAFEGVEKLVELNLTATKAALSEAAGSTHAL